MAKRVFLDPGFTLNSVNLVARVRSVTLTASVNPVDASDVSSRDDEYLLGTQGFTLSVTFTDDTTTSPPTQDVEGTLWTIYTGAAAVGFTLKRDSGTTSSTNAEYSGSVIMTENPIIDASRGDLLERTVTFQGTGTLSRSTTP